MGAVRIRLRMRVFAKRMRALLLLLSTIAILYGLLQTAEGTLVDAGETSTAQQDASADKAVNEDGQESVMDLPDYEDDHDDDKESFEDDYEFIGLDRAGSPETWPRMEL